MMKKGEVWCNIGFNIMNYVIRNFIRTGLGRASEIWGNTGFQKYFKNTGWMFLGRIFSLIVSFLVGVYIARYLGPENYGLFNYVISFVGLFGFLSSLGLNGILNREIIKDHNRKDALIGTSFYLKVAGSILAILTVFIVSIISTDDNFTLILIWLFSLKYIPQAFDVVDVYFKSQVLSKKVVIANVTAGLVSSILKLLLIFLDKGIFWLTTIYILDSFLIAFILLFYFKKMGEYFRKWRFDLNIAKDLLRDSWPLILSGVAVGIYTKIDQVMIKNMLGDEQVGLYAVAVKLSELWYFIPAIITMSLFPALVNAYKKSEEIFNKRISNLYFFMFWCSFLIAISTTFLAKPVIEILFGQQYLGSITVLQIYIWSGIFVFLDFTSTKYLLIANYTKIYLNRAIIGAVINVSLNFILIPKMGIVGGAISTLIAYALAIFSILFYKKTRKHSLLIIDSIIGFKKIFNKIRG